MPGLDDIHPVPVRADERARSNSHNTPKSPRPRSGDKRNGQEDGDTEEPSRLRADGHRCRHSCERDVGATISEDEDRSRKKERSEDQIVLRERLLQGDNRERQEEQSAKGSLGKVCSPTRRARTNTEPAQASAAKN